MDQLPEECISTRTLTDMATGVHKEDSFVFLRNFPHVIVCPHEGELNCKVRFDAAKPVEPTTKVENTKPNRFGFSRH